MIDPLKASLRIASTGLEVQSRRLTLVSENMANAESTGKTPGSDPYARKTISFESALDDASGANIVKVSGLDTDKAPFRMEHRPGHPAADANGYVKLPNVNVLVELADMREANRSYQANLQVVKQTREMISLTIDMLRTS
ncbi:MAG: flagellar basal body rod protein FlgC [Hyphomicrobiaceae bacterium]